MIKSIELIKNLGIYNNYVKDEKLEQFKKYNLFYGWNGSGKTTLSRFFRMLEKRSLIKQNIKFKIRMDKMDYDENNLNQLKEKIYVYNNEFINENINWDESINKIVIFSEDKIEKVNRYRELKKEIEDDDKLSFLDNLNNLEISLQSKKYELEKYYSVIAKNIKNKFLENGCNDYINLNKTKIKKYKEEFENINEDNNEILNSSNEHILINKIKDTKNNIIEINVFKIKLEEVSQIIYNINELLVQKISAQIIERFKRNNDIAHWVEDGLRLRKKYQNKYCEFCGALIDEKRIDILEKHFNNEVNIYQQKLEKCKKELDNFIIDFDIEKIKIEDFYDNNKDKVIDLINEMIKNKKIINHLLIDSINIIEQKIKNPFSDGNKIDLSEIQSYILKYNDIQMAYEEIVNKNNSITNSFERCQENAKKLLFKMYYLDEFNKAQILNKEKEINKIEKEFKQKQKEYNKKKEEMDKIELELSSEEVVVDKFNLDLARFIGHNELTLKYNIDLKGYEIYRNNVEKAMNLSEGEKTAISFIYFLNKVKENENDIKNEIIVIDDPISSFDSNKVFNAYSMIKNEFTDCKQLFILTHNFNFFKMVRDWLKKKNKKEEGKNIKKKASFYKIEPIYIDGIRNGCIKKAGNSLNQTTEYDYIFQYVYNYKTLDISENEVYVLGNASRKLVEAFLSFKFPENRNNLRNLVNKAFSDKEEAEQIYKFINMYSHLNVIEDVENVDLDMRTLEAKRVINLIFDKIKELDENHYNEMIKIIEKENN